MITSLGVLGVALAASLAILRHGLYEIDLVINRTVVYGALTASVFGLYALMVGAASLALQTGSSYAALILTGVLGAVLIPPLLRLYQRGADRLAPLPASPGQARPPADAQAPGLNRPARAAPLRPGRVGPVWMARAQAAWPWAAGVAVLLSLFSLPGYYLGLGEGPPDMVASTTSSSGFVYAVDVLNAVASLLTVGLAFGLALLLYRRARGEPMALYLAYYLPMYGIVIAGPLEELARFIPVSLETVLKLEPILFAVPTLLLFFLFPTGRFVPPWTRWLALGSVVTLPAFLVAAPFVGMQLDRPLTWVGVALWAALGLAGVYAQAHRYRRVSTPEERQQTKVALAGFVAWATLLGMISVVYTLRQNVPASSPMPWWAPVSELVWFLSLGVLPAALTLAVLRYRLWQIDLVLNRALVYGSLTATVAGLYVLMVGGLSVLFQARSGLMISLVATGIVAVMFQPMRDRLQAGVNRMLYGERDDPYRVLERLGRRVEAALAPEALLPTIAETVAQTLKLPYSAIAVRDEAGFQTVTSYGLSRGRTVEFPLSHQGEVIGKLICDPRSPNDPFTEAERDLLEAVARQAGVAVHAVRLTQDLRRSRERLVLAREEERRRLRRDLHDGLGPELAGMTLKLDAARNLLRKDPEAVEALLFELKEQAQRSLSGVRRLVYNLRPPALDELGLVAAVRQSSVAASGGRDFEVRVESCQELPSLPAAVEVAAYRIALEAITNAARHARARSCRVCFSTSDAFEVEVIDDGQGMPAVVHPGVGLTSMRERVAELGGTLELASRPQGGTQVRARFPLPAERP